MFNLFESPSLRDDFVPGVGFSFLRKVLNNISSGSNFNEADVSVALIKSNPSVMESLWLATPEEIFLDDLSYTKAQRLLKHEHNVLVGRLFRKLVAEDYCEPTVCVKGLRSKTHKRITEKAFFFMLEGVVSDSVSERACA